MTRMTISGLRAEIARLEEQGRSATTEMEAHRIDERVEELEREMRRLRARRFPWLSRGTVRMQFEEEDRELVYCDRTAPGGGLWNVVVGHRRADGRVGHDEEIEVLASGREDAVRIVRAVLTVDWSPGYEIAPDVEVIPAGAGLLVAGSEVRW